MRNYRIDRKNQIENKDIKKIIDGENSSIIIKNFLKKEDCKKIIKKISSMNIEKDSKKFNHIGPFLMNYTTKKENILIMQKKQMKYLKKFL